jgi:hypothetical protein
MLILMCCVLVLYRSEKQHCFTHSTTELEMLATAPTVTGWFKMFDLLKLIVSLDKVFLTRLLIDNMNVVPLPSLTVWNLSLQNVHLHF